MGGWSGLRSDYNASLSSNWTELKLELSLAIMILGMYEIIHYKLWLVRDRGFWGMLVTLDCMAMKPHTDNAKDLINKLCQHKSQTPFPKFISI